MWFLNWWTQRNMMFFEICESKDNRRRPIKINGKGTYTHSWELVKAILEENYATRRTLDY